METDATLPKDPGLTPEIEAMRLGVNYSFRISCRSFSCEVRPLSNSEFTKAYAAVAEQMLKLPEARRTQVNEHNFMAREFLKLASGAYGAAFGKITDMILDRITNDELIWLYKQWLAVCDKVNPQLERLPVEKVRELVEDIKKNPPADLDFQLTELSFGQLVSLAHFLLTPEGAQEDKSSGGSVTLSPQAV